MIEVYVVITHKATYRKKFVFFEIKNRGKKMFSNFQNILLRLYFRNTPLIFFDKNADIIFFNMYIPQIFHRGTSWLKKKNHRGVLCVYRAKRLTLSQGLEYHRWV